MCRHLLVQLLVVVLLQRLRGLDGELVLGGHRGLAAEHQVPHHDLARGEDAGHPLQAVQADLLDVVPVVVELVVQPHLDLAAGLDVLAEVHLEEAPVLDLCRRVVLGEEVAEELRVVEEEHHRVVLHQEPLVQVIQVQRPGGGLKHRK